MRFINRRDILKTSLLAGAGFALAPFGRKISAKNIYFQQGVASGDPLYDRVILWTRLTLNDKKTYKVRWQVSPSADFTPIVRQGIAKTNFNKDGIIKLDCDGLEAGTFYYYRFLIDGQSSPIGRTKTLPKGRIDEIRLGVASCANYNAGFFTAYRGLAQLKKLDAVLHLGDYIYEYANNAYGKHPDRPLKPRYEIITLSDYRQRYAHYRSDLDLQAFHAAHPIIPIWDDHEVSNNASREEAENHDPETEGDYQKRKQVARQAYFEWMPIRQGSWRKIYRHFVFGDLASLIMIDTRIDGRDKALLLSDFVKKNKDGQAFFDKQYWRKKWGDKRRQMMSRPQQIWLKSRLRKARQETLWTVIGNQIPFEPTFLPNLSLKEKLPDILTSSAQILALAKQAGLKKLPLSLDEWSGFPIAQKKLVEEIKRANNPTLVITGDTHHGWAAYYTDERDKAIGIEIATPGISAPGVESYIAKEFMAKLKKAFLETNPSMIFRDLTHRGFMVVAIKRDQARISWKWADVSQKQGKIKNGPSLIIQRATPNQARFIS